MSMNDNERQGSEIEVDPQEKIVQLLQRTPSGPNFSQSTIGYCDQSIEAALAKFRSKLLTGFPHNPQIQELVEEMVEGIKNVHRRLPPSSFRTEGTSELLLFPSGKSFPLNTIGRAIYQANPALGVFDYIAALYPPPRNQAQTDAYKRLPWFNNRLTRFSEIGGLSLDDALVKYMAVVYAAQVGKIFAVEHARTLLSKAQLFGGIGAVEKVEPYLNGIEGMAAVVRVDQAYIHECLQTMKELASNAELDEEQTTLLQDVAFIQNRAFDEPAEFKIVLEPLMRRIAGGSWNEAFANRNFLLNYFSTSFPQWRTREHVAAGGVTFEGFRDLVKSVLNGKITIYDEDVPADYKSFFGATLPKKLEKGKREKDAEIIKGSLSLSRAILEELAWATKPMADKEFLEETFYTKARVEHVISVMRTINISAQTKYDRFQQIVNDAMPHIDEDRIHELYTQVDQLLNGASIHSPYALYVPSKKYLQQAEFNEAGQQICWYPSITLAIRRRKGEVKSAGVNSMSVGKVLYEIISQAIEKPGWKGALPLDRVKLALNTAYQQAIERNPNIASFTLADYLWAILRDSALSARLTDSDPVILFIKELEKFN